MRITDCWNLTREGFIVQLEGTQEDALNLLRDLNKTWPEKKFFIVTTNVRGLENETRKDRTGNSEKQQHLP